MRLVHFLIGKAILEALFVAVLVAGFYVTVFHTNLRGECETNESGIVGWIVDASAPSAPLEIQLYVDDRFVAKSFANNWLHSAYFQRRAPVGSRRFQFDIPPLDAGEHVAEVYAVRESGAGARRVLQLIGNPVRFVIGTSDKNRTVVR